MTLARFCWWFGVACVAALGTRGVMAAQTTGRDLPPLAIESLTGRDSFERYCASCHGVRGAGNGPVAAALQVRPADLTTLTVRNAGTFPRARVRAQLEGASRNPAAHGTSDMPVWGPTFRALERSDTRVAVRIDNLVSYVESLQAAGRGAPAPPDGRALGAQLFRTHCATCHGDAARGVGPMSAQLRKMPPDLTRYTTRNNGVFPGEAVRRIIDGRDIASHGDREMPIWGDAFRRSTGDSDLARERIDAIVVYLESIQVRAAE